MQSGARAILFANSRLRRFATGFKAEFGIRLPLGPAQVGRQDHRATVIENVSDGGQNAARCVLSSVTCLLCPVAH